MAGTGVAAATGHSGQDLGGIAETPTGDQFVTKSLIVGSACG